MANMQKTNQVTKGPGDDTEPPHEPQASYEEMLSVLREGSGYDELGREDWQILDATTIRENIYDSPEIIHECVEMALNNRGQMPNLERLIKREVKRLSGDL